MSKMPDPQAGLGEGEAQRQADVASATEDDDVKRGGWRDRSTARDRRFHALHLSNTARAWAAPLKVPA